MSRVFSICRRASSNPCAGSSGVDGTLRVWICPFSPTAMTSVKVPPESMPIRTPTFPFSSRCLGEDSNRQGKARQARENLGTVPRILWNSGTVPNFSSSPFAEGVGRVLGVSPKTTFAVNLGFWFLGFVKVVECRSDQRNGVAFPRLFLQTFDELLLVYEMGV